MNSTLFFGCLSFDRYLVPCSTIHLVRMLPFRRDRPVLLGLHGCQSIRWSSRWNQTGPVVGCVNTTHCREIRAATIVHFIIFQSLSGRLDIEQWSSRSGYVCSIDCPSCWRTSVILRLEPALYLRRRRTASIAQRLAHSRWAGVSTLPASTPT